MDIAEDLAQRVRHRIGWEVGSAIENVIWAVAIAVMLMGCAVCACGAVAWKIIF